MNHRRPIQAAVLLTPLLCAGCLNPNLVNTTFGGLYPTAPGSTPFVLATIVNDTPASIDLTINVDEGRLTPSTFSFRLLDPLSRTAGILIAWPFLRMAIGDLDNPFNPSITATFPDGTTVQIPFGHPALKAGQDVNRGDTILFRLVSDARSPTAITVSLGVVPGSTQTGPFQRADTFETTRLLLLLNGLGGTLATPAAP